MAAGARVGATALLPLILLAPGCLALDQCWTCKDGPPKPGQACQVVTTWSNKVHYVPDVLHDGVPMPGLAGRLYLFGPNIGFPMTGDGGAVVELYDDSTGAPNGVLIERWEFDAPTLQKLLRKDIIGWGYTLFLPWGTYRPDITRVHLTCRYEPAKGTPLYADASPLTVEHEPSPAGAAVPAAAQVPAAPNALPMPRAVQ
jgi:hypothetical protein